MKILVTNYHPSGGGGHTTYISSLLTAIPKDIDVCLGCPGSSLLYQKIVKAKRNISIVDLEFPGKLNEFRNIIKQFRKLRRLLIEQQFDVIHVNGSPDHRLVMLVLMTLSVTDRPKIVFTKHNSYPFNKDLLSVARFRHYCDAIICVCEGMEQMIPKAIASHVKVVTIENGVDTNFFKPIPTKDVEELRVSLGISKDDTVLVSCAGNALHKGWQYMAEAMRDEKSVKIVLLGQRPSNNFLREVFAGVPPKNLIFAGMQEDVRPYLSVADIGFVLSTSVETASFACREMLSMKLPVIVSDFGFLPNNVNRSSGWVVAARSVDALRSVLHDMKQADLDEMGREARKVAVKRFGIEQFISDTYSIYRSLSACGRRFS